MVYRMAPRGWATDEQKTFLESYIEKYLLHQTKGILSKFWPSIERKWFKRWPAVCDNESGVSLEDQESKLGEIIAAKKKVKLLIETKP